MNYRDRRFMPSWQLSTMVVAAAFCLIGLLILRDWSSFSALFVLEFGLLVLLVFVSRYEHRTNAVWRSGFLLALLSAVYAADEWFQPGMRSRRIVVIIFFGLVAVVSFVYACVETMRKPGAPPLTKP
jgi:hypothetical protein